MPVDIWRDGETVRVDVGPGAFGGSLPEAPPERGDRHACWWAQAHSLNERAFSVYVTSDL